MNSERQTQHIANQAAGVIGCGANLLLPPEVGQPFVQTTMSADGIISSPCEDTVQISNSVQSEFTHERQRVITTTEGLSTKAADTFSLRDEGKSKVDTMESEDEILNECGGISGMLKRLQGRNDLPNIMGKLKSLLDAELTEPMITSTREKEPVTQNAVDESDHNTDDMLDDFVQVGSIQKTAQDREEDIFISKIHNGSGIETSTKRDCSTQGGSAQHVNRALDNDVELPTQSQGMSNNNNTLCYSRQSRILESKRSQDFSRGHHRKNISDLPEPDNDIIDSIHDRSVAIEEGNVRREDVSIKEGDLGENPKRGACRKTAVARGTACELISSGSMVNVDKSKAVPADSKEGDVPHKKRKDKFEDRHPPSNIAPVGDQKLYPLGVSKDVWVLHPTRVGSPVAIGKTGYSFKTTKSKLQASPWRTVNWETGLQVVEIQKVLQPGMKVMHPSKQLNKSVKLLDDVQEAKSAQDASVLWVLTISLKSVKANQERKGSR
ncbi:hypothetical protein M758_UG222600 [Ceratodon purpureus]|nr:hypothetical protein M758_UG222600 [Ceratodon purpureus]